MAPSWPVAELQVVKVKREYYIKNIEHQPYVIQAWFECSKACFAGHEKMWKDQCQRLE